MKIYLVNSDYSWTGTDILTRCTKKPFSTYEKALEEVRRLIEEDKQTIRYENCSTIEEKEEKDGNDITRFWLYWRSCGSRCSHCWEIHELTVE
jgi:hypothetical protein